MENAEDKELLISPGILKEMKRLHEVQKALEAKLGAMRINYLEAEAALFRQIAETKRELGQNAKNALLAAGIETGQATAEWTIDLTKGTIEKA